MIGVFVKDPYSDIGKDLTVFIPKFDKIKIEWIDQTISELVNFLRKLLTTCFKQIEWLWLVAWGYDYFCVTWMLPCIHMQIYMFVFEEDKEIQ